MRERDVRSTSEFITTDADQDRPDAGPFELENRATPQVNLQSTVYAKPAPWWPTAAT
jgi:hypothetical protein